MASPAIGRLEGPGKPPDIVVPSLDAHLYAFRPDGTAVPHFPRLLQDPSVGASDRQLAESIDETLAELSGENLGFKGDVTSEKDLNGFFDQVRSLFGKIDILFINAGIATSGVNAIDPPAAVGPMVPSSRISPAAAPRAE